MCHYEAYGGLSWMCVCVCVCVCVCAGGGVLLEESPSCYWVTKMEAMESPSHLSVTHTHTHMLLVLTQSHTCERSSKMLEYLPSETHTHRHTLSHTHLALSFHRHVLCLSSCSLRQLHRRRQLHTNIRNTDCRSGLGMKLSEAYILCKHAGKSPKMQQQDQNHDELISR